MYNKPQSDSVTIFEGGLFLTRIDLEKEKRFDEGRNADPYAARDPYHSEARYDSESGPYDAFPQPYPYGGPKPRPYRYGMALAGFILGLFGALVPASIWLQILFIDSIGNSNIFGGISLLSLPLAGVCAVIGLILSIISVRSSRGAKYAIAGICLSVFSFLIFGTFFIAIFFFLMSI